MNQFTHLRASCNTVTAWWYAVQFSFNDVHEAFKVFYKENMITNFVLKKKFLYLEYFISTSHKFV